MFLYIDPLKQGLKHEFSVLPHTVKDVFIHRSIKTRIETKLSLLIGKLSLQVFIHRSIKTRIET